MTPDQRLLANFIGCLIGIALLVGAGAWGGYAWRDATATAEIETLKASFAGEREALATKQTAAVEQARTEERRAAFIIQEALDAEVLRAKALEASRRRADAAHRSLRDQADTVERAFAALAAHDSAATEECRAAAATASVCTGLLSQCSEERRAIADFAEASHGAGQVCVGAYRALSPLQIRLGGSP